ncbi:MAG: class II fumarate hydratase [Acidimicrobiia bacterium]|nr:class II fumarate hydratase [Acidimicrobiia bacterium]
MSPSNEKNPAVPENPSLYGSNTALAIENFPISGEPMPQAVLIALGHVKAAAATANTEFEELTGVSVPMAAAITSAADEIIAGGWADQFPVDVFQTGSETSTNMNMNEVIATLAERRLGSPVHPNDHVNASQSSNDTIPSAIRVAALTVLVHHLLPALRSLEEELAGAATRFDSVVKAGRTHLMDATPIMLGDEFTGYRFAIGEAVDRLTSSVGRVGALPLGGTATGNELNAPVGYATRAVDILAERTDLDLTVAANHFAVQGGQDSLVELSAQLRNLAVTLFKIANDVRWLGSGPRTGLSELILPELQPGSSIMPGKTNPVICEVVLQVCAQVFGNDAAIAFAGSQGDFELNVFLPLMARNLLDSLTLLTSATTVFAALCSDLEANEAQCRAYADATLAGAARLNLEIGYDAAAHVVKEAHRTGRTVLDVVVDRGLLDPDRARRVLDPSLLARPNSTGPQ